MTRISRPDYFHGKIYAVSSPSSTYVWYGSCTTDLQTEFERLYDGHEAFLVDKAPFNRLYCVLELDDVKITLVEDYPCGSQRSLTIRCFEWIDDPNSFAINEKTPIQVEMAEPEYMCDAEDIIEEAVWEVEPPKPSTALVVYERLSTKENKLRINREWAKRVVMCSCGVEVQNGYHSRHLKTDVHVTNLLKLNAEKPFMAIKKAIPIKIKPTK